MSTDKTSNKSPSDSAHLGEVNVSLTPQERFEEYLQTRGMRNTEQRRSLISHVFSHHEHFDADTLIEQLPSRGKEGHVSRPTVYRTLRELVDAGLLREFELDGRAVFEHDYGYPDHDHFYCTQCQKLIEFASDKLREAMSAAAAEVHFQVTSHRIVINGVCQDCRSKKRTRRKLDLI